MDMLSIGQVAQRAGVGIDTIRFYEREGILEKPLRRDSGYRQYSEEVVRRIRFIQRAKLLGFSLKEITELLALRVDGPTSCAQVKEATLAKLDQVERKLVELERMRRALLQVASLCTGEGLQSRCPMLDALDQQEQVEPRTQHKEAV
jgi:MerR family mercuric resistance operon transcriptional regulator